MPEIAEMNPAVDQTIPSDNPNPDLLFALSGPEPESLLTQAFAKVPATDFFGEPWCKHTMLNKLLKNDQSPLFEPESDSFRLLQKHFLNPKVTLLDHTTLHKNLYETVIRGLLQLRKLTEGTFTEKPFLLSLMSNTITKQFAYIHLDTQEASLKAFNSYLTKFTNFALERILEPTFKLERLLHPEKAAKIAKALENIFFHVFDAAAGQESHVPFLFYESQDTHLTPTLVPPPAALDPPNGFDTLPHLCA